MIVFIRICVFCSFLALNTTHIWAADLSCWSQVGFFTIYPDKYKIKKKKRRSCAGQHLSWCRTERLCSFPTGLELISSDSKGHHDQNKFKKKPTELEIWANDLFSPFYLHSDEKLTSNILWKFLITLSATSSQGIVGEKKKKKRVLTCKHC